MKISSDWISNVATQKVCETLTDAGYQALFVGGCVRNALMGVAVADIDISTDAHPQEVMRLAKAAGLKTVPTGIDHGTVTVVAGGIPHEVTTFRKDVQTFGRRAVVAFAKDVADDARRRDFTMNALYARADGTVIDPLNGLVDLQARRLRFIEDPERRIREDYLRILRFFRFHAWYGDPAGGLDAESLAAIAANVDGLADLSRERVGAEMLKLLAAPDPALSVAAMRAAGVLQAILPGASDAGLAPLVHLESEYSIAPSAIRRLAVLGGSDVCERLRLSKSQARHLGAIRDGIESNLKPHELGYRNGCDEGWDILLARAALCIGPVPPLAAEQLAQGAAANFPLKAADLMPEYSGPALGKQLKALEQRWIDSGFALGRDELL